MVGFGFDTREIERFVRALDVFATDVPRIGAEELMRQILEYAASGVDPSGRAWPVLTLAYAQKKAAMGLPAKPNKRLTGALLTSLNMKANSDGYLVAPVDSQIPKAQGLEKLRISFQVAPITSGNVERLLLKRFYEI